MKKVILSAVAALITAGAANAQIRFAPELGLNLASLNGKYMVGTASTSVNSGMSIGARIGAVADIGITENIYVRPGIQFSMLGGKDFPVSGIDMSINYIQVPISVLYKLSGSDNNGLYFGLVPYFGFALGGKMKDEDGSESLKIGSDEAKDNVKPLDFGAGVKVGYELPMGLYFDASFMQGLANLVPGGNSDNKYMTRNITIGVGYFLMKGAGKGGKM